MGLRGPRQPSLYQYHEISSHQLIFALAAWPEEGGGVSLGGSWAALLCSHLSPQGPSARGLEKRLVGQVRALELQAGQVPGSRTRGPAGVPPSANTEMLEGRRGLMTPARWQLPEVSKAVPSGSAGLLPTTSHRVRRGRAGLIKSILQKEK